MLRPFYSDPPQWESFDAQIGARQGRYTPSHRGALAAALREQYQGLPDSEAVLANILDLEGPETYTVVTGHQLNLFTGPLYFFYKLLACINTAEGLRARYPGKKFVPIYWMATEDHDFDEINYFDVHGTRLRWDRPAGGAVGRMETQGLEFLSAELMAVLGPGRNAGFLKTLFDEAYLTSATLAEAHRKLVHRLFGGYGLLCLDGDDARLKRLALPYFEKDIEGMISHRHATENSKALEGLSTKYRTQAHPREVNFFYLSEGKRRRIVHKRHRYELTEGPENWTKETLLEELHKAPERFSPNVIMRPVYQEALLPNLAYLGGGGELAYWLQLKGTFSELGLHFPLLMLRPSLLLIGQKLDKKMGRLGLEPAELFLPPDQLVNAHIRRISEIEIDFTPLANTLKAQFVKLYELAAQTDGSFLKAVKAQEAKQVKGLNKLEKRLLNAQRRRMQDEVARVKVIRNALFPSGSLQERSLNFSEFYEQMGEDFVPFLKERLEPFPRDFRIESLPF